MKFQMRYRKYRKFPTKERKVCSWRYRCTEDRVFLEGMRYLKAKVLPGKYIRIYRLNRRHSVLVLKRKAPTLSYIQIFRI